MTISHGNPERQPLPSILEEVPTLIINPLVVDAVKAFRRANPRFGPRTRV